MTQKNQKESFMTFFFIVVIVALMLSSTQAFGVLRSRGVALTSGTRLFHTYSPKETAQAAIKASEIMVFSKTHCPFCRDAKEAIKNLTPQFSVMELDVVKDGADIQAGKESSIIYILMFISVFDFMYFMLFIKALLEMTGQKTVPSIFVNGKHVGGCDDTLKAIANGEFQKLRTA